MLTCKEYAEQKKKELKQYISEKGLHPCLVVIQVGDDPASNSYIRGKMGDCEEVGIKCILDKVPDEEDWVTQEYMQNKLIRYGLDNRCHGIILQLPIPKRFDLTELQSYIFQSKDVDGFTLGSAFDPCTPAGVIGYLKAIGYEFEGKDALVIGRSPIVGKPLADMLTDLDCTVTLAHSKTKDLDTKMGRADIMFTCIDKIEHFHGAIGLGRKIDLIDIGLGVGEDSKLHGNWNHVSVEIMKQYLRGDQILISGTGGVGLLTRVALLENVVKACDYANG
jgi:methylenetetrahydrofolate dehydrogenase (NADP+)/methenyltetrahydrofolate cyclohydrolase